MYINQQSDWPNLYCDNERLLPLIGKVRNVKGKIIIQ